MHSLADNNIGITFFFVCGACICNLAPSYDKITGETLGQINCWHFSLSSPFFKGNISHIQLYKKKFLPIVMTMANF